MNRYPDRASKHHILFPRQEWELRPQGRKIRQTPSMIPIISRGDHDYIHDVVPLVPALGWHTLLHVPDLWTPTGNTLTDLDLLCTAIDKASKPQQAHQLERDLAGLAIEALMMEKTVLKDIEIRG